MRIEVLGERMQLELGPMTGDLPAGSTVTVDEPVPGEILFDVPPDSSSSVDVLLGDSLKMTVPTAATAVVTETQTPDFLFDYQVSVDPDSLQPVLLELDGQTIELEPGAVPTTPVNIDVRPLLQNWVNRRSRVPLPVAVLSSDVFDASTIDAATIMFAGAPVRMQKIGRNKGKIQAWVVDVNHDGRKDLLALFDNRSLDLERDSETATLTGETVSGEQIRGTDTVSVIR